MRTRTLRRLAPASGAERRALLVAARTRILRHPEALDATLWYRQGRTERYDIAGAVLREYNPRFFDEPWRPCEARHLLGLTPAQGWALFYLSGWPAPLRAAYLRAKAEGDHATAAAVAAERIDVFLADTFPSSPPAALAA